MRGASEQFAVIHGDRRSTCAEPTPLARLVDGLQRDRYGTLDDAGIADALRGWIDWRLRQSAEHPAHAVTIAAIFEMATRFLREEAMRRKIRRRQPAGPRLTTTELLARHSDRLRPAGAGRWRALCPWHRDKQPSLVVYDDGYAHCYACGAHRPVADLAMAWTAAAA